MSGGTVRVFGCVQEDGVTVGWSDSMSVSSGCPPMGTNAAYANRIFFDMPAPEPAAESTECPEGHMCSIPELSFEEGVLIAAAIGGVWALGLIARLFVRATETVRD